jgi:phospholipase C
VRRRPITLLALAAAAVMAAPASAGVPTTPIRHIVVLMQENHSFDNYFGTYPGVDGLPAGTCLPRSFVDAKLGCRRPSHVGGRAVQGLGSDTTLFARQLHGGSMDGFVAAYRVGRGLAGLPNPLGYYDNRDIPYLWNLADRNVLFDRFFSSARGGSAWNHMFAISATPGNPSANALPPAGYPDTTTIFDRLEGAGVPWRFYVKDYDPTNTIDNPVVGERASQLLQVPLLAMPRVVNSPRLRSHIVDMQEFYRDAQRGRLPAVSYIAPGGLSEHPPAKLITGQTFVRSIVNELMRGPEWSSTAFVLTYDSWGGWYDHVLPPEVDRYGYGFRVPALLVSPYAKRGAIDHTTLDFTSILRFIEDNWGLAPLAGRDSHAQSIATAFDFSAPPRLPEFVPTSRGTPRVATARTRVVFWAYGGAGLLALAFVAAAFASSRRRGGSVVIAPPASRPPAAAPTSNRDAPERLWERWPDEPEHAWRAFVSYRDMKRGTRSQRAVSSGLRHEALSAAQSAAKVREWSVRWYWSERCRAYDRHRKLEVSR